jgi:ATPase subunit of ABC transporter with duplicated ATPase domains
MWLESYLRQMASTIIIVSHDRTFLNNVSTDIILLHHRKLDYYAGDYANFLKVPSSSVNLHVSIKALIAFL